MTEPYPKDLNPYDHPLVLLWNHTYHRALSSLLLSAKKEILISTFKMEIPTTPKHYALKKLIDPLIQQKNNKPDVKLLLHYSAETPGQPRSNLFAAYYLQTKGVLVRHLKTRRVIHAKIVIIDTKYLITGSHNWSSASVQHNLELSLLLKQPDLIQDAREHFLHYWGEAVDYPTHPPKKA